MHTADWNPTLSEYVKADTHNAERLLTVFEHRTESRPPVSLLIQYIPPSSTLTQFTSFLTDTFTHLATFQTQTNMTPIILTDANAHCNSGGDDLRQFNIPNRTKPYAHRHSTGHKKNASQTPPAKRGDILEIHTARNNYSILNDRAPGENLAPTFTASNRNTVTDYIIVPISQYHDVVAFNILPSTNLQFNTDHNVLHLISNDLPDPTPPFPDGLRPDAVCHEKYALIDLETRKQYRLAMNAAVGPWYRNGFDDLKRSLEAAQHKPSTN